MRVWNYYELAKSIICIILQPAKGTLAVHLHFLQAFNWTCICSAGLSANTILHADSSSSIDPRLFCHLMALDAREFSFPARRTVVASPPMCHKFEPPEHLFSRRAWIAPLQRAAIKAKRLPTAKWRDVEALYILEPFFLVHHRPSLFLFKSGSRIRTTHRVKMKVANFLPSLGKSGNWG